MWHIIFLTEEDNIHMNKKQNKKLVLIYIVFGILAKILPHPSSVTPLNNLFLHAGSKLTKVMAVMVTLIATVLADIILSYLYSYPIFGYWSFFTYSGFIAIALLGSKLFLNSSPTKLICCVAGSSLIFWVWTNFGCWLIMPNYSKDLSGLINCYIMASPFLKNSLLGDLAWSLIVFNPVYRKLFFAKQISIQKNK